MCPKRINDLFDDRYHRIYLAFGLESLRPNTRCLLIRDKQKSVSEDTDQEQETDAGFLRFFQNEVFEVETRLEVSETVFNLHPPFVVGVDLPVLL